MERERKRAREMESVGAALVAEKVEERKNEERAFFLQYFAQVLRQ